VNRALIIIDEQMDYFPGGRMELVGSEAALEATLRVLDHARKSGWKVFHIQHLAVKSTATFFLPGTPGVELHPSFKPGKDEPVVQKNFPNSFRGTGLAEKLKEAEITDLVVCGMMTHMCVDTTVRAAFDLGFTVELVPDACATKDLSYGGKSVRAEEVRTAYLAALSGTFARLTAAEELIRKA